MRVYRYSLVPIEFLDLATCQRFVESISSQIAHDSDALPDCLCTFTDSEIDECVTLSNCSGMHRALYRMGSACVVVLLAIDDIEKPTFDGAIRDLSHRREKHHKILRAFSDNSLPELSEIVLALRDTRLEKSALSQDIESYLPTYVFSYSIIRANRPLTTREDTIVKLHAQPGLLGIEDTPGLRTATVGSDSVRKDLVAEIRDCDTITGVKTYCTWATVTSTVETSDPDVFLDTATILLSLELRLQAAWNKCAVLSAYCDRVAKRRRAGNLGRTLSWLLVGTVDDARTIVTSMASHRINRLFKSIVETSGLEDEILRAERKLGLVNELIDWERERQGALYQRTTETLLLIVAVGQIASLFYDGPIFQQSFGPLSLGLLAIIGAFAIWSKRL